tara:strand:- start:4666 stop:5070 length:405 start_codon:yes stop_codon:yes gene_type:complete
MGLLKHSHVACSDLYAVPGEASATQSRASRCGTSERASEWVSPVELTSKGERKNQNQRLKGTLTAGVIYTMSNVAINSLDPLFTFQALENGSIVGGAARNRAKSIRHSFHQALADARPRAVARTHFEPTAETLT